MRPHERIPPHDLDAERAVLGSMLQDATMIDDVRIRISAEDFYLHAHQLLFRSIIKVAERSGVSSVDLVTLSQQLHSDGSMKDAGGDITLAEIYGSTPAAVNAPYYAQIVQQTSIRRQLIYAATNIMREAYDPTDPETTLDTCEKMILKVRESKHSNVRTLQECGGEVLDRSEAVNRGARIGLKTGMHDLDEIVLMKPGDLIIVAARPSVGKTIVGTQVATHVGLQTDEDGNNLAIFFASVEMPGVDIAGRILSSLGSVDGAVTAGRRAPDHDESVKLAETFADIGRLRFFLDDSPDQTLPIIASNARRLHRKHKLALVVVDYLQLIQVERQKGQTRAEALGEVSRGLKRLARELKVPVLALAQLNRDGDGEPELQHIRESGDIEADADQVWMPWKGENFQKDHLIYIKVAKHRGGPTGQVTVFNRREFTRFDHFIPGFQPHEQPLFGDPS